MRYIHNKADDTTTVLEKQVEPIYSSLDQLMHSSRKCTTTRLGEGYFVESLEVILYANEDLFEQYATNCIKEAKAMRILSKEQRVVFDPNEMEKFCVEAVALRKRITQQQQFNQVGHLFLTSNWWL